MYQIFALSCFIIAGAALAIQLAVVLAVSADELCHSQRTKG